MIVIDASAMVEVLLNPSGVPELAAALEGAVAAPHLLDAEILQVLRGLERARKLTAEQAAAYLRIYLELDVNRIPMKDLAPRIWELRHQVSAYDASYVALAEALDAPLWTADRRLSRADHRAVVRLLDSH